MWERKLERIVPFGEFIPQNEMVVLAGDMNWHVGSTNVGYDGMDGGYEYEARNADG